MLKEIDEIRSRLIDRYNPERIILFGSRVAGQHDKASDIDLVVIKETDQRPFVRQMEVESLLSDRAVPIDIVVYTPEEMRYLYSVGSPFVEEIVENGRLLYMRKATSARVRDAEEELESATVLYDHKRYKSACYHGQQSVEKGLKAIIIEKGKRPDKTHDIVELYNTVKAMGVDPGLSIEDAVYLNSIYRGRYPTEDGLLPHGEPSQSETDGALSAARRLVETLKRL